MVLANEPARSVRRPSYSAVVPIAPLLFTASVDPASWGRAVQMAPGPMLGRCGCWLPLDFNAAPTGVGPGVTLPKWGRRREGRRDTGLFIAVRRSGVVLGTGGFAMTRGASCWICIGVAPEPTAFRCRDQSANAWIVCSYQKSGTS